MPERLQPACRGRLVDVGFPHRRFTRVIPERQSLVGRKKGAQQFVCQKDPTCRFVVIVNPFASVESAFNLNLSLKEKMRRFSLAHDLFAALDSDKDGLGKLFRCVSYISD